MKLISKKNCTTIVKYPFTIFEIRNFLPQGEFIELLKSFPNESFLKQQKNSIFTLSNNEKVDVDTNNEKVDVDSKFKTFLNENENWKFFFNELNSKKQIDSIYNLSLLPNLKTRGFSALKKWVSKDQNFLMKKITRKVQFQLNFFILKQNAILYPHTDAKSKLVSLVYYLSDTSGAKRGTDFWEINRNKDKWKNLLSSKFHEDKNTWKNFNEDCKIAYKSEFESNKLVGFFRNDESVHSVAAINTNENISRKTLSMFLA